MREKLIESLKRSPACICDLCGEEGALDRVAGVIADNLINDGVTIPVRCGDCKAYDKEVGYCEAMGFTCEMNDFCSYGERRTDG